MSHNIDYATLNAGGTVTDTTGATWYWTYLLNGKKCYYRYITYNFGAGDTNPAGWRNSSNYATLPAGLTYQTAFVIATIGFPGNGETRLTVCFKNDNRIYAGGQDLYYSGAFTARGYIMVFPNEGMN